MRTRMDIAERALAAALLLAGGVSASCTSTPDRPAPQRLAAPYDTAEGDVLWAVVPLRNESGTTLVDPLAMSDRVAAAVQQIEGVSCLPVNRTVLAMRALGMNGVSGPEDAARLATELGVDGLVLGSVTAWDPYEPPVIGLNLGLYARGEQMHRGSSSVDVRSLSYATTDFHVTRSASFSSAPVATVSLHLDARDAGVLEAVRSHAVGRSDPATALGWRVFLHDMDAYAGFAAVHGVGELLGEEWLRLARMRSADVEAMAGVGR